MRILMVSMNSIHFQRWANQFKDTDHELFWFDIRDGAKVPDLSWLKSFQGWKNKFPNLKGRTFIKNKFPSIYKHLENNTAKSFEKVLLEVKPDVVHSFVLYISCAPILKVMQKYHKTPWIYSSWGSDLYYYRNIPDYKEDILRVLPRINYLITDCKRDVIIAKELGFKNEVLGVFPGGGGFDFKKSNPYIKPVQERNIILVKGYQGRSGRAIEVLKALEQFRTLIPYDIVVFGADTEVVTYIEDHELAKKMPIRYFSKNKFLSHDAILKLMGESLIYIGNSNSDGMPNTLLEAIIQGAFPIQSNPGGVSEEVILHKQNGLLINDCNDVTHIKSLIEDAILNQELIKKAFQINQTDIKLQFEIESIKTKVLQCFDRINV